MLMDKLSAGLPMGNEGFCDKNGSVTAFEKIFFFLLYIIIKKFIF